MQEDINNGTDTDYEIEICRVKFTAGAISQVVSQIGSVATLRGILDLGTAIVNGDNLDSYTSPGTFYATAGLGVSSAPAAVAYKLIVLAIAPGIVMQLALSAAGKLYMRVYAGTWTSWTSGIEAVTDLPAAYNEGDVYIKV